MPRLVAIAHVVSFASYLSRNNALNFRIDSLCAAISASQRRGQWPVLPSAVNAPGLPRTSFHRKCSASPKPLLGLPGIAAHLPPKSLLGLAWNQCSACPGTRVQGARGGTLTSVAEFLLNGPRGHPRGPLAARGRSHCRSSLFGNVGGFAPRNLPTFPNSELPRCAPVLGAPRLMAQLKGLSDGVAVSGEPSGCVARRNGSQGGRGALMQPGHLTRHPLPRARAQTLPVASKRAR